MEEIMTVPQVAGYLKLSKSKVYYLVQTGQIRHIQIGRSVRIREADLQQWIQTQMSPEIPEMMDPFGARSQSRNGRR
jgi:excisionase family DNA binding protein